MLSNVDDLGSDVLDCSQAQVLVVQITPAELRALLLGLSLPEQQPSQNVDQDMQYWMQEVTGCVGDQCNFATISKPDFARTLTR